MGSDEVRPAPGQVWAGPSGGPVEVVRVAGGRVVLAGPGGGSFSVEERLFLRLFRKSGARPVGPA